MSKSVTVREMGWVALFGALLALLEFWLYRKAQLL